MVVLDALWYNLRPNPQDTQSDSNNANFRLSNGV